MYSLGDQKFGPTKYQICKVIAVCLGCSDDAKRLPAFFHTKTRQNKGIKCQPANNLKLKKKIQLQQPIVIDETNDPPISMLYQSVNGSIWFNAKGYNLMGCILHLRVIMFLTL